MTAAEHNLRPEGPNEMIRLLAAAHAVLHRGTGKGHPAADADVQAAANLYGVLPDRLAAFLLYLIRFPAGLNPGLRLSLGLTGLAASARRQPKRKRAELAAKIEALKKELVMHIRAARDHAFDLIQSNREPKLLKRPSKSELSRRAGLKPFHFTRCFNDDPMFRELWRIADNLDLVMKYGR